MGGYASGAIGDNIDINSFIAENGYLAGILIESTRLGNPTYLHRLPTQPGTPSYEVIPLDIAVDLTKKALEGTLTKVSKTAENPSSIDGYLI